MGWRFATQGELEWNGCMSQSLLYRACVSITVSSRGGCDASALLTELYLRKWGERRVLPSLPLACQTSALLLSYTPNEMERVNGIAPLSRPWHGRILLLNHTRKEDGVPSRTLTGNLTLRTRPLYKLSYGDENWYARLVTLRNPALI